MHVRAVRTRHRPNRTATDLRLIESKLAAPDTPSTLVVRTRLLAMLDRGVHGRLTLVTGPAGTGKTTLLASWMKRHAAAGPAAWMSIDKFDNDPTCLRTYLAAALHRSTGTIDPALAGRSDASLVNSVAHAVGQLAAPVVLVLDNVQSLGDGPAAESLASLLRQRLPTLHIVLGTRGRPALPLEALRLAGELAEINADDLAFSPAEATELCARHGAPISGDHAEALVERTEGLAAGVCLAAITARERIARGPAAGLATAEESLADFFRSEVLSQLPSEVREFLLCSSVVDELNGELATALTGRHDAAPLLDRLRRDDQLVRPADGDQDWLRYRGPLLDFLRREARTSLPNELPALHLRAAHWYQDHDQPLPALRHAAAAGDWRCAAALVVRVAAPQVLGPGRDLLRQLPARMPAPAARREPEVAATLALAAAAQGDGHTARYHGELVRRQLSGLPVQQALPLTAILHLHTLLLAWHDEDGPAARAAATELIDLLDTAAPGLVPATAPLRAIALGCLGTVQWWEGNTEEAERTLQTAAAAALQHGLDQVAAGALGSLAFLHAVRGELPGADELAHAAAGLDQARDGTSHAVLGRLALGLVAWLRGDTDQAHRLAAAPGDGELRRTGSLVAAILRARVLVSEGDVCGGREALDQARRSADGWPTPPLLRDWLAVAQAAVHLAERRPVRALTTLTDAMREPGTPVGGQARVLAARAYLATGAPARAASLVAAVPRRAAAGRWARVEAWLVEALSAAALDHHGTVAIALSEALSAAAPDLVEPFHAAGASMAKLLDRHPDLLAAHAPFAVRLAALRKPAGAPIPRAAQLPEPITKREDVVLRFLPTLLTTEDIARELSVSPNTVKTHLRNIYRKLSVGTRRDAVHRARTLGLLHP